MKPCPMCAEEGQDAALLCRFCNYRFVPRQARDERDRVPVVKVQTSRLTWVGVVALVLLVATCAFGG